MNKLVILFVIVACLSIGIDGRVYQVIDSFSQFQSALQLAPSPYGETPADYDWFSPYNTNGVNPPAVFIKNTGEALGGQRDSILGFKTTSSSGITARFSLLPAAGTALVAFPIGYVGASYVQWDGNDQSAGQGPTVPFPAAILSRNPGIGSNVTSGGNADGRSYDFTFAGAAKGLTIQITSDLDVVYTLTALDTSVGINIINLPIIGAENVTRNYYIRYDDRRWTQVAFNWAQTTAFQVKVTTNGGVSGAIDTSYRLLNIYTFEIGGTVYVDCGCDGTPEGGIANLTMDLFNTTGGINVLVDNTNTNATGSYRFFNFNFPNGEIVTAQTYRICIRDTSTSLCNNQNRCTDVTLSNPIIDQLTFDYYVIPPATLAPPPDVSLECGQSTATSNTGVAQLTSCNGTTPVTTNSDSLNQQACVTTITRTFTDTGSGRTVTQRITVTDTQPPTFTVQPSSPTVSCGGTPTLAQYVQSNGGAQAIDTCNFQGITNNFTTGGVGNCGAITLQFTARDTCGLTATAIGTYTSNDVNPPTFTQQPTPLNIECDFKTTANNPNTRISNYLGNRGGAVVTDDCTSTGSISFTNDFTATTLTSSTACAYTQTVTFTARDQCNNAATATSLISVSDTQNPQITVPAADVTTQCSTSGTGGANPQFQSFLTNRGGAQATDLCASNDGSLVWSNDYTGNGQVGSTCGDQVTVTFTVTDACGRTNSTTARYLVVDNTPPTITTRASNASPQCDGNGNTADYQNFITNRGGFVASDNCGSVVYTNDAPPTGPTGCGQSVTVTFTASQQCSPVLSVVSTATYTVLDSTPPTFVNLPQSQSIECGGNPNTQYQAWLANNAGATVTDACSPQGLTIQNNAGTQTITSGCNNAITVTFTARDGCNNVSPGQTATFRVQDTIAPVFTTQPTSVSVTCNSTTNSQDYTNFLNNNAGAVATDSCSNTITYTNDSPGPVSATCNFVRTVTFTARDGCGLTATTSATFSITDNTPPTITTPAAPVSVECTGDNSADLQSFLNTRGGAQAVDNCGGVTWTNDFTTLPSGCIRSVPVTFTARDVCGLTATTTATYTVSDNSSPVISVPANDVFVECDRNSDGSRFQNFLATRGGAQATDVCSPQEQLVWTNTPAQSPESCSTAQVTFTVTDPCGRSASTTASFTVRDRIAPVFTTAPQPVQVECNGSGNTADYQSFIANRAGAVATDACALNVAYTTNAPATGPVGCGFVTAQFTAADECGNAATVTTTFRVVDTVAPVFITAPQNRTVECNPSSTDSDVVAFLTSRGNAVASDSCYTSDSLIWSNNYRVLTSETCRRYATVTFTVRDPCGASNTATATFESVDRTAPQILVGATSLTLECNSTNAASIQTYLAQNGGASATDSCTTVSFTNDFTVAPEECTNGVPVVFTARDVCGNSVTTTGLITIVDSTPPSFRVFPNNVRLGCDRDISPANAGTPTGFDLCDTNTTLSYTDVQFKQPDELFCPGDLVTIRTWVVVDDCGNFASKNQTITTVFSGTSRPCLPSECPLCELDVCCPVVTERVLCNPVPCNSVPCRAVGCTSVPCIPNSNCGSVPSPDPQGPGPQPSVLPSPSCEPVYIYIFDDDGPDMPDDVTGASGNNGGASNASAAGSLVASLLFTVFLLFALI